jgi:hypothetical protein
VKRTLPFLAFIGVLTLSSCVKKETAETATAEPNAEVPAPAQTVSGPHAVVNLKSGGKVPGVIVASSKTDMVVAGDDGIEHKIPLEQVKSVEYGETQPAQTARQAAPKPAPTRKPVGEERAAAPPPQTTKPSAPETAQAPPPAAPRQPAVTTRTYELPPGSEISVRTDEAIDSETAAEGQTFEAQVTRNATDVNGDVVIPQGSRAEVVIKSASKGGRFRGASDLVLDLQSVTINGREYSLDTVDVTKQGKEGLGANKRTGVYTGGGAAIGAIIGAIAGGGKGAAIGAGAGAGAGALTQILTKGRSIKVPAESVLTFNLDQPLKVTAAQ